MSAEPLVARRQVEITNPMGFHMRPADKFARLANSFGETEVRVRLADREFNGKSIMELTLLAAECGTWIELVAQGPQAEDAVSALAELVLAQFHETDGEAPVS